MAKEEPLYLEFYTPSLRHAVSRAQTCADQRNQAVVTVHHLLRSLLEAGCGSEPCKRAGVDPQTLLAKARAATEPIGDASSLSYLDSELLATMGRAEAIMRDVGREAVDIQCMYTALGERKHVSAMIGLGTWSDSERTGNSEIVPLAIALKRDSKVLIELAQEVAAACGAPHPPMEVSATLRQIISILAPPGAPAYLEVEFDNARRMTAQREGVDTRFVVVEWAPPAGIALVIREGLERSSTQFTLAASNRWMSGDDELFVTLRKAILGFYPEATKLSSVEGASGPSKSVSAPRAMPSLSDGAAVESDRAPTTDGLGAGSPGNTELASRETLGGPTLVRNDTALAATSSAVETVTKTVVRLATAPAISALALARAIATLERTLVAEGDSSERNLVLRGHSNRDIEWAGAPHVHPDAQAWLAWRVVPDFPIGLWVPTGGTHPTRHWLVAPFSDEWQRLVEDAAEAGRPELIPILDEVYSDGGDGSVWLKGWDEAGDTHFERYAGSLPELLGRIEAHYAARAGSPLRLVRVDGNAESTPFEKMAPPDAPTLARLPVGSVLVTTSTVTKWFAKRGSVALKLGTDQWHAHPNRNWEGGSVTEEPLADWMTSFRFGLANAKEHVESDAECAALIGRELGKPDGAAYMGSLRVWTRPPIETLITRLDEALKRFPEVRASLRPGASETELRDTEQALGVKLPKDVRQLFSFANGQAGDVTGEPTFYWRYRWISLAKALKTASGMRELREQRFGSEFWSDSSLPFLERTAGDHIYIDIGGRESATPGAIVEFNHEAPSKRPVRYGSVTEWLECFVDALDADLFVLSDGSLWPREFEETGDLVGIRQHDEVRTNERYPWEVTLRLQDR